ncbi:CPBP family intramembrane metalloprotease [Carnobacteriaceae bacterium zg-ZUI252]|nr:CPBP family intramembrane metalloprotease [Carnobacteriaceae bacterium zg-ZUI252]MBS4770472.1 CPBP family intramembrane metalloprotease [Carnobacteriaceae bacterium zg-ZUI240]QTU82835.1 CPBP family intramembrane metalloprotease [Carnobacteriaceae bacterium zg-C25]
MAKRRFVGLSIIALYILGLEMFGNMAFHSFGFREDVAILFASSAVVFCIVALLKATHLELFNFRKVKIKNMLLAIGMGYALTIVANLIMQLLPKVVMRNQASVEQLLQGSTLLNGAMIVIVVVPFLEEIVFRGVFLNLLLPKHPVIAIVLSSVLFAFAHSGTTFTEFVTYFLPGMILGFLAYYFKGIEYSYGYHAFTNALGFVVIAGLVG